MSSRIYTRDLYPWLRGKRVLYPVAGLAFLLFGIIAIPCVALWEFRQDAKDALGQAFDLMLMRVYDES